MFYSTWVKPACCVSKISSDGGCQSKETGVGMEVRLLSVGARGFFLAASRLAFVASPLNSVAPNERKNLWHPGYQLFATNTNIFTLLFKELKTDGKVSFLPFAV